MTSNIEHKEAEAIATAPLLTIEHFRRWEAKYAHPLTKAEAERKAEIHNTELARQDKARDAIFRRVKELRKSGLNLDEAGDVLRHNHQENGDYSYTDLHNTLVELGCQMLSVLGPKPWRTRRV